MRIAPFLLVVACQSPASPPPDAPRAPAERREPDRFELYALLFENGHLPLADGAHCDGVVGVQLSRSPTLADWVAYNLSVLEAGEIHLPSHCTAVEGAELLWECDLEFQSRGGEDPWNWGVRLRVKNADRTMARGSLVCTGSG